MEGVEIRPCRAEEVGALEQQMNRGNPQRHPNRFARQQKGELHFRPINYIHMPVGGIILLMLIAGLVLAIRRRDLAAAPLLGFILAALIGNAIICGVFSNPHARYQSRLIWVPAFALALLAVDRRTAALRPS